VKQVQITIPFEKTETVYDYLLDVLNVKNVMKISADNAHMLLFRVPDGIITDALDKLKKHGVGVEYGFIDILDLKASLPRDSEETDESITQRDAALAVEEIYDNVKKGASLGFDFVAFIILAAAIAGLGLIQNNATIIVASMLLSPLMGPMLGVALGYVVNDHNLFIKGTFNELIALALSFSVGAILGVFGLFYVTPQGLPLIELVEQHWTADPFVATEITRRGLIFSGLDIGIAVFSGAAVAVSVTRGDMSALVGVAISASLMPPAVNVGMMITLGLLGSSMSAIQIGIGSLLLLGMNIIIIDLAAIIMFRVKRLAPLADKSATWKAVTAFKKTRKKSLYHAVTTPLVQADEKSAATFTATPESVPTSPTPTTESEEKSAESE
jgi:uncharacterized hydrophobic protein (TIGR00271 family)